MRWTAVLPNDFLAKPALVASDGNIYMGGSEGLVRINKALKSASIPPPITLEVAGSSFKRYYSPLQFPNQRWKFLTISPLYKYIHN